FLAAFCTFVKFTAGLSLIALVTLFLLCRRQAKQCLHFFGGAVAGVICFFVFEQSPQMWWQAFSQAVQQESGSSHTLDTIGSMLTQSLPAHSLEASALLVVSGATQWLLSRKQNGNASAANFVRFAALAQSALIVWVTCTRAYAFYEAMLPLSCLLLLAALIFTPASIARPPALLQGGLFVCLLPLAATVGTNCDFFGYAASNMGPWYLSIGVLAVLVAQRFRTPWAVALVPFTLCFFSVHLLITQYIFARYEGGPLLKQTATIDFDSPLRGLKMSPADAAAYTTLYKALSARGFQPGDALLELYDMPGVVYAMRATSPGQAFYVGWPERDKLNAYYMKKADLKHAPRLFLILSSEDSLGESVLAEFTRQGLPFPESFERIGTVGRPGQAVENDQVDFYVRK
ncbi:MAG: hypothetical protein ACRD72_23590, partial [Candidatus Angelobacter sp.]